MRSLMEFPGLKYYTFASTVQGRFLAILLSFIKGVFPIVSNILFIHIARKILAKVNIKTLAKGALLEYIVYML